MKKIEIGTSGFYYRSNKNKFYPEKLTEPKLTYYARYFNSVEINSTFYKLPTIKTFENWYKLTPDNFNFSIKLSKDITHVNKLKLDTNTKTLVRQFLKNVSGLQNKLKVILIQLPKSYKYNPITLDKFLEFINQELKMVNKGCKLVIEFRSEECFNTECFKILKKYKIGLVINDSYYFPKVTKFTSSFSYIRMHGPLSLYTSNYTNAELNKLKDYIETFPKTLKQIYIYFNNDFNGYAVNNALFLKKIINKP
ncbi:MAG: DUF72 domain-containing protein [Candidatus Babeliales bacterium]|nr:DUF72 domain-containing protein [Candidatus Babeliales bacterium]